MSAPVISWSGLRRYEECHQKHKLVMTGTSSPTTDGRNFLPGTVADRIMRAWLESDDPRPGQMEAMVEDYFHHYAVKDPEYVIKWRGKNDFYVTRNFVRDVVTRLEPILLEKVLPYDFEPELKFDAIIAIPYLDGRLTGCRLVGGMDLVVRQPGDKFYIYDLKATKNDSYWRKTLGQLTFYDIALQHWLGLKEPPAGLGFIQPMCKEPFIEVSIGQDERTMMMSRIIAMASGIWRREWEPNVTSQCRNCEVKHACEAFKVDHYVDESGQRRTSFGKR